MLPSDTKDAVAEPVDRPPLPDAGDRHWAWFLDVDGTLLEIARHPDFVAADRGLLRLLQRLKQACDGAVALISGRSLAQLEAIFSPLTLAAGASHGLELRSASGAVRYVGEPVPAPVVAQLAGFVARHDGLLLERKSRSVSVHYRERPELEDTVLRTLGKIHTGMGPGFRLLRGKMVAELTSAAADKGSAIRALMEAPPFKGRKPVFAGDDVTDEDGFAAVNEMGGLSVRIGEASRSAARWHFANIAELRDWLRGALHLL